MKKFLLPALLILAVWVLPATGQIVTEDLENLPVHKSQRAFSFSLASNGMGLGGLYRFAAPGFTHVGFNVEFFALRDDKEFELINPFTGIPYRVNDLNRFFIIPANLEMKKRLFPNSIEDNFRPHIMLQAGVVFGMNFPKEQILEGVVIRPANQFQVSYNGVFGFGADIFTREKFFVTIRPQYRVAFFPDDIAGKKNHSSFEIKFEIGGI